MTASRQGAGTQRKGKWKSYPEYKDSGIEWLGEVPEHWIVVKLGYNVWLQGGYAFKSEDFHTDGVPIVRMNNLKRGRLDLNGASCVDESKCLPEVSLKSGDLLFGMSGSIGETGSLGNFAIVATEDLPCQLNQRVGRFLVKNGKLGLDFLSYLIQTPTFYDQILLCATGTAQFNISSAQVETCLIPRPPFAEQRTIASFLDRETARIDALIEKKQRQIELLQEKRAALISHAVTGKMMKDECGMLKGDRAGSTPHSSFRTPHFKDSGIEWLGEVPEGWEIKRLTYFCSMILDGTHFSPQSDAIGDYLYITAKNIKEQGVDLTNVSYISEEDHREIYKRCPVIKGDVLYIKDGATAGIATVNQIDKPFSLLSSVALIRPRPSFALSRFIAYHLNERAFKQYVLNNLVGGAMTRFTVEIIKQFRLVVPPLEVQHRIVSILAQETLRIDALAGKVRQSIEMLREYRTALISAAVTGKIDVRDE